MNWTRNYKRGSREGVWSNFINTYSISWLLIRFSRNVLNGWATEFLDNRTISDCAHLLKGIGFE